MTLPTKVVLTYAGLDIDGTSIEPILPMEVVDIKATLSLFQDFAFTALTFGQEKFSFAGHPFYVFNFYRSIHPARLQQIQRRVQMMNVKDQDVKLEDLSFTGRDGRTYLYSAPRIETLEAWFDRVHAESKAEHQEGAMLLEA